MDKPRIAQDVVVVSGSLMLFKRYSDSLLLNYLNQDVFLCNVISHSGLLFHDVTIGNSKKSKKICVRFEIWPIRYWDQTNHTIIE